MFHPTAAEWLQLLLTLMFAVLPAFATEVLTKARASRAVKSMVAVVLSAGSAAVQQVVVQPGWDWGDYLAAFVWTAMSTVVTHYWGATTWLQTLTARFGFGRKDTSAVLGTVAATTQHVEQVEMEAVDVVEPPVPDLAYPVE